MRPLTSDVGGQGLELATPHGLCPVADLPVARSAVLQSKCTARGALQTVGELRDGHARRMAEQDVDVIGCVSDGEDSALDDAGLSFQERRKPGIEAGLDPRVAMSRRPDEMDEEAGEGVRARAVGEWVHDPYIGRRREKVARNS